VWDPPANEFGWRAYLGERYGSDDVPATAAPARAQDLSGLPPAYIFVGSADLFFDEDVAYAQALSHAGVPTDLRVYAGAVHGFDGIFPAAGVSLAAKQESLDWLRRAIAGR
jgi:acetyl esterase/lipase